MGGRLITIEGIDGAGKSTQIRPLAAMLRAAGLVVTVTREPGGAPGADDIRRLLVEGGPERWDALTETLLHVAARRDHLTRTVRPALDRGEWVVSDRFADSTMAYQGYGLGIERETVAGLHTLAIGDFRPDLTLLLDLPAALGFARIGARRGDETRYERMDAEFHRRIRDGFLDIAEREPERCVVIDARGSIEDVSGAVRAAVKERLGVGRP